MQGRHLWLAAAAARTGLAAPAAWALSAVCGVAVGCGWDNGGVEPPRDAMYFPSGLLLDPTVAPGVGGACVEPADCGADPRWTCLRGSCRQRSQFLIVSNSNGDRRFFGGTVIAFDLDDFFAAIASDDVREVGERVSTSRPCRRAAGEPQLVECDERPFAVDGAHAHVGDFGTVLRGWDKDPGDNEAMLLTPIRGDRAILWMNVISEGGELRFSCGQGDDPDDPERCSLEHMMRFRRNDASLERLAREPFYLATSQSGLDALAWVGHLRGPTLTLISLDGLRSQPGRPAIVDQPRLFSVQGRAEGAYGIAQRPCDPANAPTATVECTVEDGVSTCEPCRRPLMYGAFRYDRLVNAMTAYELDDDDLEGTFAETCVDEAALGEPGAIACEARATVLTRLRPGGLPVASNSRAPLVLGEMQFSRSGDELFITQTTPGALLRVDTSLDADGSPVDLASGEVEVCAGVGSLALYEDGSARLAAMTCYGTGQLFVVDLDGMVVTNILHLGTGPGVIIPDFAREVLYVANYLDATISVVDMAPDSARRFSEIARLGLQEPYSR